ncbi:DUF2971 domain-containing protein [Sphingopyxis lindanitolerans]|uniref:DUF2971 domain-containing protein n=3 Tax=Sphingomonadaceae TaxID=41297 RepID=A0A246JZ89_9SPHN|nr:hypothetical protein CDQ91_08655 [Sphingopyxis witflariensis]PQM28442.1 DUF2971 domain-containing protein [Sphingopyxis lindanitolerans]
MEALSASYLFAPPFSAMNDPMEAFYETGGPGDQMVDAILGASGKDIAEIYALVSQMIERFALVSFAGTVEDLPMWAYYGSNFGGMCLEFDTQRLAIGDFHGEELRPVTYARKALPPLTVADVASDGGREAVLARITRKRSEWSHEKEWRYVVGEVGPKHYLDDALKRVYIGPRAQPEEIERICAILDQRPVEVLLGQTRGFDLTFETIKPARTFADCEGVGGDEFDRDEALYAEDELRDFLRVPFENLVRLIEEAALHPNFVGFASIDTSTTVTEAIYMTTIYKLRNNREVYHQRFFDRKLRPLAPRL